MNLHEYQAKQLFKRYGLPVPTGYVCKTVKEMEDAITKLGKSPWIIKCQIHSGSRGKSYGIKIVNNYDEVLFFANNWLGKYLVTNQSNSNGQLVNQILLETVIDIYKELYLSVMIDYSICRIIFIISMKGGINIEETLKQKPELICKVIIDTLIGPIPYQARELAYKLGLNNKQVKQFIKIFIRLVTIFMKFDLTLIEINPLVITKQGDLIFLDSKINVDNNALYRQIELQKMRDVSQEDPSEFYASKYKLNYVSLNGNIGCMANGAGLAMGTIDIIKLYGGIPANFLDVGGSVTKKQIIEAFKIILFDKNIKSILINIFGGIVCCNLIADGIIEAVKEVIIKVPVIVRFEGNNAKLGIKRLSYNKLNITIANSLIDAVKKAILVSVDM
ncbi:MAG: ADP-forming succinate--CoA ligase subunit beta [Arsenophonus endosymbiont of Ceratovacuna japonica]